jgi:hypothetical protein
MKTEDTVTGLGRGLLFWKGSTENSDIYIVPKGLQVSFVPEVLAVPEGVSIGSMGSSAVPRSKSIGQAQR